MPAQSTRRQPLSCENCRKRKIKCPGKRPPCETCIRRGFAHTCFYLRNGSENDNSRAKASPIEDTHELVDRIKNLEALLHHYIGQTSIPLTPTELPFSAKSVCMSTNSNGSLRATPTSNIASLQGSLETSPSGHQRYMPHNVSSMATSFNQVFQPACSEGLLDTSPLVFDGSAIIRRQDLIAFLPPSQQCNELKAVFFEVFSPLFHILHDPSFEERYSQFQLDPNTASMAWLGLLFVILSIAVTALDEDHKLLGDLGRESTGPQNIRLLSKRYRSAAMKCLTADDFLWRNNLDTLQALILLIYALNHAHGQAWALLGLTYNIALSLGCHVDPARLGLNAVECEERRRAWAGLTMLQTVQNTCLGVIALQQSPYLVSLPADVNDSDISRISCGTQMSVSGQDDGAPTQMTYILYKFRLYKLAAEICQLTHSSDQLNRMAVMDLHRRITIEQEEHSTRFFNVQSLPLHHIVHHHILISYTNQLYLILHRPFLTAQNYSDTTEDMNGSFGQCEASALAILDIHELVHNTPEFGKYQWYHRGIGSFHAFFATMILSVLLAESRNIGQATGIHTALKKCLQRFKDLSDRSPICERAVPVLTRLTSELFSATKDNLWPSYDAAQCSVASTGQLTGDADNSIRDGPAQFGTLLTQMPPEQWLNPSTFSWDAFKFSEADIGGNNQQFATPVTSTSLSNDIT